MKTLKSFKKFGKLCPLAFHLYLAETFRESVDLQKKENRDRYHGSRDAAIERSGLDTRYFAGRRLCGAVERSVQEGVDVLTFAGLDAPFWELEAEEFDEFLSLIEQNQISEFVYESRDSSAYETFFRLEACGWKIAGLTRRPTDMAKYKIRRCEELTRSDYIYGIRIKKSKKN